MSKFFSIQSNESIVLDDSQFNSNDATHGHYGLGGGCVVSLFVTDNDKLLVGSRVKTACEVAPPSYGGENVDDSIAPMEKSWEFIWRQEKQYGHFIVLEDDSRCHPSLWNHPGSVHCLKATMGDELWSAKVSNSELGDNYMTLATPWSSRLVAEAYTSFSQTLAAQARDIEREAKPSTA